jgi:hypothetical protein
MSIMMSDSLKDIVSIGQLTGEISQVSLTVDDEQYDLDLFSFTRDAASTRLLAFASRGIISSALKAKTLTAIARFEGEEIGKGKISSLGFETVIIHNEPHDMIMLHIKRNN